MALDTLAASFAVALLLSFMWQTELTPQGVENRNDNTRGGQTSERKSNKGSDSLTLICQNTVRMNFKKKKAYKSIYCIYIINNRDIIIRPLSCCPKNPK